MISRRTPRRLRLFGAAVLWARRTRTRRRRGAGAAAQDVGLAVGTSPTPSSSRTSTATRSTSQRRRQEARADRVLGDVVSAVRRTRAAYQGREAEHGDALEVLIVAVGVNQNAAQHSTPHREAPLSRAACCSTRAVAPRARTWRHRRRTWSRSMRRDGWSIRVSVRSQDMGAGAAAARKAVGQ
jgi:hypothetical protein